MKPVTQNIFINDPQGRLGNCLQACIASICEVELEQVPHFVEDYEDWFAEMCNWLHEKGYSFEDAPDINKTDEYVLVFGPSPRGRAHAVIYKHGVLAHDPHPSRDGVLEVEWSATVFKRQEVELT